MLRYFFVSFLLITVAIVALAGFRGGKSSKPPIEIFPDMDHQPKFQPQHPSRFFADGSSARKPVAGTIPVGYTLPGSYLQAGAKNATIAPSGFTNAPDYYNTGRIGDVYGDGFPTNVTVNEAFLKRGRGRYDINCAVCHGKTGMANGIVGQYGLAAIANLVDDRVKAMPDGQLYNTVTNGKNTMGAYGPQIAVEDRWAIVAYIRALQRTTAGKLADLPKAKQEELQAKK
jgi:mono/diheme cytochrome c family protein